MPRRRGDTRVIVVATLGILVLGLVIAASILLITGRAKNPEIKGPVAFGIARNIKQTAEDGGPFVFAGNSGDDGFWIAIENGKLVALKIRKPGTKDCNVIWKGSKSSFVDCDGNKIPMDQLARYPITIPTKGGDKGVLLVNLSGNIPPPAGS